MESPNHPRLAEPTVKTVLGRIHQSPRTIDADASLAMALGTLVGEGAEPLLVLGAEGLIGSFSAEDYARAALRDPDAIDRLPVRQAMSAVPPVVAPGHTVRQCLALMETHGVHAVAVVEDGKLVGHLSARDLLKAALDHADRVFYEIGMDQRVLFARGLYSC